MRISVSAACLAAISASAFAQTGTYTWEASSDGVSWSNGIGPASGPALHVRLVASWTGISGSDLGFAGGQFDVRIPGGASDNVTNITRPAPFDFGAQTLLASVVATDLKIDTATDVAGIGLGTGWVNPGQVARGIGFGLYNSNNPAVVMTFDWTIAHVFQDEGGVLDMVLNQTSGRAMAVYTSSAGATMRLIASEVTVVPLNFIPTAGPLSCFGIAGLVCIRRSRRH